VSSLRLGWTQDKITQRGVLDAWAEIPVILFPEGRTLAMTADLRQLVQQKIAEWREGAIEEARDRLPGWVGAQATLLKCADELADELDALCLDVPARQDQETKEDTRVDDGQPRRIAPTGSTASTDGGS
jgi:hypothetical protein